MRPAARAAAPAARIFGNAPGLMTNILKSDMYFIQCEHHQDQLITERCQSIDQLVSIIKIDISNYRAAHVTRGIA